MQALLLAIVLLAACSDDPHETTPCGGALLCEAPCVPQSGDAGTNYDPMCTFSIDDRLVACTANAGPFASLARWEGERGCCAVLETMTSPLTIEWHACE